MAPLSLRDWRLAREADSCRRVHDQAHLLADLKAIADRNRDIATAVAKHIMATGELEGSLPCPACGGTLHYEPRSYTAGTHTRVWTETACETPGCIGNGTPR